MKTIKQVSILTVFLALNLVSTFAWSSPPDFVDLVEANRAAVVNISTTQKVSKRRHPGMQIPDLPEGHPFGDLFRRFFGDEFDSPRSYDSRSLGSGFIVSRDGYILTNTHVVAEADEIIVRLSDRRELEAELVGSDKQSDLALLKIDANDLPVVKMGTSENLKVGEWVLAIGTPFGFEYSATAGIVSAKGRSLPNENYVPFIQTDVAINPGNSGGPLFNTKGEVVGVNSQIYSGTGGYMGLSFAIPIEVAQDVMAQLKHSGHVSRGWLGVLIQDVTPELARSFGMDMPRGALVAKVVEEGPGAEGGLQVGDVIVEFNGQKIKTSSSLPPLVGRVRAGESVNVRIIRNGKEKNLRVKIGELPDKDAELAGAAPSSQKGSHSSRLGLTVEDLDEAMREETGIKQGVLVTDVAEGPAEDIGLRSGDIIQMIDNRNIKNTKEFNEVVGGLTPGRSVAILIQRKSGPVFLAMRIPQ